MQTMEPFAEGVAHVRTPVHMYVHLVCELLANYLVRIYDLDGRKLANIFENSVLEVLMI